MKSRISLLYIPVLVLAASSSSRAGHIGVRGSVQPIQIVDGGGTAGVTVANEGDEIAYTLSISALLPDGFKMDPSNFFNLADLAPSRSVQLQEKVRYSGKETGSFIGALVIQYTDANVTPLSSIFPIYLVRGRPTRSTVTVACAPTELAQLSRARMVCQADNPDPDLRNILIQLIVPREMTVSGAKKTIALAPRSRAGVEFDLADNGAQSASSYYCMILLEYSLAGEHFATAVPAEVIISFPRSPQLAGIAAISLLLLALFVYLAWKSPSVIRSRRRVKSPVQDRRSKQSGPRK